MVAKLESLRQSWRKKMRSFQGLRPETNSIAISFVFVEVKLPSLRLQPYLEETTVSRPINVSEAT